VGGGENLLQLMQMGFLLGNLVGNELLEDRAEAARKRLSAAIKILVGDAAEIDQAEGPFDIVYQSTDDPRCSIPNFLYRFLLKAKIGKFELVATDRPPFDAPASVAARKFRIGYTARPVRQRVVFHPLLEPIFLRVGYPAVRYLRQRKPGNPKPAKAEGLFRFALEGKRPLAGSSGRPKGHPAFLPLTFRNLKADF